jgi:hypothetical protein
LGCLLRPAIKPCSASDGQSDLAFHIDVDLAHRHIWVGARHALGDDRDDVIAGNFKAANDILFVAGLKPMFNGDPLVFDLNGDGVNLTAVSPASPQLDTMRHAVC